GEHSSPTPELKDGTPELKNKTPERSSPRTVKNHQGTNKEPKVVSAPPPEGVSAEVWADYLGHKAKHKGTINATVLKTIKNELAIAKGMGWSADDALAEAMSAGWRGLKAAWLQNRNAG